MATRLSFAPTPARKADRSVWYSPAMQFKLVSKYEPRGDQPEAIRELSEGIELKGKGGAGFP